MRCGPSASWWSRCCSTSASSRPTSTRSSTPRRSYFANFSPGLLLLPASIAARRPAAVNASYALVHAASSCSAVAAPAVTAAFRLGGGMGMQTTSVDWLAACSAGARQGREASQGQHTASTARSRRPSAKASTAPRAVGGMTVHGWGCCGRACHKEACVGAVAASPTNGVVGSCVPVARGKPGPRAGAPVRTVGLWNCGTERRRWPCAETSAARAWREKKH